MIAYHTGDMHHTRAIGSYQRKEDLRVDFALQGRIPDSEPLLLERDQMLKPREQKRVNILWVVGPRNEATDKHPILLVTLGGREIQQYPDVDPTGRGFLGI